MRFIPPAEWLTTQEEVNAAMNYFVQVPRMGIDTETTGLNIIRDRPVIVSMATRERRVGFLAELAQLPSVRSVLGGPAMKVGTNIKFDLHMLANAGIQVGGELQCTLALDHYYDENRKGIHGLKETTRDYIGLAMKDFDQIFPKKLPLCKSPTTEERIHYALAQPDLAPMAMDYATKDPFASILVADYLREELTKIPATANYSLCDLFDRIEGPFTRVLWNMERRGFTICLGYLRAIEPEIESTIAEIEGRVFQRAGRTVNLRSPKQLIQLLFVDLGHKPTQKTPTGNPSTDVDVLTDLAAMGCEVSKDLLEVRKLDKQLGTYVQGMQKWIDGDLRIHTVLAQHIATTGRLSSSSQNLQNIPAREKDIFHLRDAFVAAPGKRLIVADYDQLEIKILAHLSQDQGLIGAIRAGRDLHCHTASLICGFPYDDFVQAKKTTDDQRTPHQKRLVGLRNDGKVMNFGIIYGMGPDRLAEETGKSREDAQQFMNAYFQVLPGVGHYIEQLHQSCRALGFVTTLLGRRRRLSKINAIGNDRESRVARREAEREAQNAPVQGSADDLVTCAMLRVEADPELRALDAQMLLQIHDELVFEVPDDEEIVQRAKARIRQIMEDPFGGYQLSIPITISCNDARSWGEAKD
jgi:DNA polymerase-1